MSETKCTGGLKSWGADGNHLFLASANGECFYCNETEIEKVTYCNACHKLEHATNEPCPEFAELCDLCNTPSINYAVGAEFWNCLCETCWNKEKDLI